MQEARDIRPVRKVSSDPRTLVSRQRGVFDFWAPPTHGSERLNYVERALLYACSWTKSIYTVYTDGPVRTWEEGKKRSFLLAIWLAGRPAGITALFFPDSCVMHHGSRGAKHVAKMRLSNVLLGPSIDRQKEGTIGGILQASRATRFPVLHPGYKGRLERLRLRQLGPRPL